MDVLGLLWWGSVIAATAAALYGLGSPRRRRPAMTVAAVLFLMDAWIGILSIGLVFLPLSVACALAALRAGRPQGAAQLNAGSL